MLRVHELMAAMNRESQEYKDFVAGAKFDLGEIEDMVALAKLSTQNFYHLPAPTCVFQLSLGCDVCFALAKTDENGVGYRVFHKNHGRWRDDDLVYYFLKVDGGQWVADAFRVSTGNPINRADIAPGSDDALTVHLIQAIACAVEVFSCSNVTTIEHQPPKLINQSRKKKGKVPFFSYRTLHITGERTESSASGGGTHASPRLHLRRGHIRRLASGGRVWVRSALVGDKSKGFAGKDYAVDS